MGLISEKMKFDFLVRLKFDISEGYDKAGIKTAYNDFARTLRTDNLKEKKSKTEKFLLKELKELISLDIKNQEEFDEKHRELCEKLKKEWNELSYGQIQKWVNMSLKYWLLFGGDKIANIEKNAKYFHIPIDSIIKEIAFGEKRNQADYKSWSKIENYDEESYIENPDLPAKLIGSVLRSMESVKNLYLKYNPEDAEFLEEFENIFDI